MRSQSLPPSEMKSLYGSITRRAVIALSYVSVPMILPLWWATRSSRPLESERRRVHDAGTSVQRVAFDALRKQGRLLAVVRLRYWFPSRFEHFPWDALLAQKSLQAWGLP